MVELDASGKVLSLEEKPEHPRSHLAIPGIYFYDSMVWDLIETLVPSARGELEITDVNNQYIQVGRMEYDILEGWWTDAGTFQSLLHANQLVARTGANRMTGPLVGDDA